MEAIDQQRFGAFVAALRKEKEMTQRQLAQQLFLSDKAVSKWERGLSLPDISILPQLAAVLGVTVTELLAGQRMQKPQMDIGQVEQLLTGAMGLSKTEQERQKQSRRNWRTRFALCCVAAGGLTGTQLALGQRPQDNYWLCLALLVIFSVWACLIAKETLPRYYDENKISSYSDGIFRMNLVGVHFNNSNWPHILQGCRRWLLGALLALPTLSLALGLLLTEVWLKISRAVCLTAVLGLFVPIYITGKKYE